MYVLIKLLILFIIIIVATVIYSNTKVSEGFQNTKCPDILIQKGKHIFLYKSNDPEVPGINPIKFNNLEEYVEYFEWQRSRGKTCPVLYLEHSYNAQGKLEYVNRPSPFEKDGGLPLISGLNLFNTNRHSLLFDATRNNLPWNKNLYPGFDPYNQNIGLKTPLDKMEHQNPDSISPSPMDDNWGGGEYTESRVEAGDYKDNEVKIYVPN
mgnify:CR=1 FL=1|tara:strand:+ start:435 stop:1061 length:627 start_codon:yes stop_codon:yes gene_type:complete